MATNSCAMQIKMGTLLFPFAQASIKSKTSARWLVTKTDKQPISQFKVKKQAISHTSGSVFTKGGAKNLMPPATVAKET